MSIQLDNVLAKLTGVSKVGATTMACCPAHPDRNPSLAVAEGDDGAVLLTCHAGCSFDQIVTALGLTPADLFPPREQTDKRRVVKTYPYTDETGDLLYEVVRFDPKDFRQRRPDGHGGHIWNLNGTRRVLYRLPEILEAVKAKATVFICEGEKDADAIVAAGYYATTAAQGAGKWHHIAEHAAQILAGVEVIVVADRDEPGRAHARQVAESLAPHAGSVIVVEPEIGKDAADHLATGRTIDNFVIIDWNTPPPATDQPEASVHSMRDRLLTITALRDLPPPTPLIDTLIDVDNFGILYGRRGSYKSFLALNWGLAIATGLTWDTNPTRQGTVVYVVAEGISGTYQRIEAWCQHREIGPPDNFYVLPEAVNLLSPSSAAELADTAAELGATYIVIDTLARCMVGGDENAAKDAGIAVDSIDLIRRRTGAHVLGVHHAGKDTKQGARGSSAFEAAADTVIEVSASEGRVVVKQTKQKNRPEGPPIYLFAMPVINSVVLGPLEGHTSTSLTKGETDAVAVLREIEIVDGVSLTTWIEAAADVGISRGVVTRARKKALDFGVIGVSETSTPRQPRYITTDPIGVSDVLEDD